MVSALYAVLGALLLVKFSFDVVRLRTQYHVGYGDGGFSELQVAIRVHGNAVEYVPIGLHLKTMNHLVDVHLSPHQIINRGFPQGTIQ